MSDSDDLVGYKRPPRQHRFKKGRSGNPSGRPKARKRLDFAQSLTDKLSEIVTMQINGLPRQITKIEAIAMQLVNKAALGDVRVAQLLTKFLSGAANREMEPFDALEKARMVREALRQMRAATCAPTPEDSS